jgi:survival-of-motor-neuron-related-splicing factor 30
LGIVHTQLKDDPDNAELLNLQAELNDMIALLNESLAELKPAQAPQLAPSSNQTSQTLEKWPREEHATVKKTAASAEDKEEAPVMYQVNDSVLAKWTSGDKAFYPARITSVTGSSTAPIYTVKFKQYDNTETLRAKDIRPVSNKRKADANPATTAAPISPPSNLASATGARPNGTHVLSAAANMYAERAKKDNDGAALDVSLKPPKAKKIKAKKELEAGKSKWQEFSSKSKFGKTQKKDSMFRTPEGIHGRGKSRE